MTFEFDEVVASALRRSAPLRWGAVPDDVIPLTAAEIDFPVAAEIVEAAREHVDRSIFGYAAPDGSVSLREAAAQVLAQRHQLECPVEQIVTTLGTAAGIWSVVHGLCAGGDECIVFDPVDLLFAMAVESAGATVVRCPMAADSGSLDIAAIQARITSRTKLICLCNPHNPLGSTATESELRALASLCVEHDITLLADEVWCEIVYPPARHISVAALDRRVRTYTVFGPSKTFGMPGFRIGFVAASNVDDANGLRHTALRLGTAFGLSPVAETAAEAAFRRCWPWRDAFVGHLREQRNFLVERLNAMPGITCRVPDATYLLFPNIAGTGMSSAEFAAFALDKARVALVPGTVEWFGPGADGHVRISFATSHAVLDEAMSRIQRALEAR